MRFKPDLLPGFSVEVEDPISADGEPVATVLGFVNEVNHVLSSSQPRAQTSFSLSYVRYKDEVPEDQQRAPFYPEYDPEDAAQFVLSDALGL